MYEIIDRFIVIESLDGVGTSTQMKLLQERSWSQGVDAVFTFEPTDGVVGQQIRTILARDAEVMPETLAMLYAADRNEHLFDPDTGIVKTARSGRWVFCDRYLFSSLAYQGTLCDWDFVFSLNARFPLPEYLLFVDLSPEAAEARRKGRSSDGDLLEGLSLQHRVYEQYQRILQEYTNSGMKIHILDGRPDPEVISDQIWQTVFR